MKNTAHLICKNSLLVLWSILGLFLLGASLYTSLTSYEQFTDVLLQAVHKSNWRSYFQSTVLPLSHYTVLPYLLGGCFFCWLLISPWYSQKSQAWSRLLLLFLRQSQQELTSFWRQRTRIESLFLCLIIGAACIRMFYYIEQYALQYDEAWTYNHFISNGLLVAAISPNNNHILYTLLACLTDLLPLSGQYTLRLPVLMGGVALLLTFYKLARQSSSLNWALLGLTFLAFAPAASLYSLYARGYIFQILFTVIAISASWQLVASTNKRAYQWTWWSIAHILGLYSVPTHAYVLLLTSSFLLWKGCHSRAFLKAWGQANWAVIFFSCLLYAPYFLTNGSRVLWTVASQNSGGEALWSYQDKVADWLLWGGGRGTSVYGFWLMLVGTLLVFYYKKIRGEKTQELAELVLLFLLFPTFLNVLIGTQPPYRIWCFLSPFLGLWLVIIGQVVRSSWGNKKSLLLSIIVVISTYSWRLEKHYALQWSAQLDWQVKNIAHQLLKTNIQQCYLFSNYDKPLLEYYYLRQGKRLNAIMASPNSKDYAPFQKHPLYEAVLWDMEDRKATPEEEAWLEHHYPVTIYKDARVQLRLPKSVQ